MGPELWGPHFWATFHTACLAGTATPNFVTEFTNSLPCPTCASHFTELLERYPFPETRVFEWSVQIHNKVNERLGKSLFTPEQAYEELTKKRTNFWPIITCVLLILLILSLKRWRV